MQEVRCFKYREVSPIMNDVAGAGRLDADADDNYDDDDDDDDIWDAADNIGATGDEATSRNSAAAAADYRHHGHEDTGVDETDAVRGQRGRFGDGRSADGAARGRVAHSTVPDLSDVNGAENRCHDHGEAHDSYDGELGHGLRDRKSDRNETTGDLGHDDKCLRDRKSDRNETSGDAGASAFRSDIAEIVETQSAAFVRQQRMKWLEANNLSTIGQPDSQSRLVIVDKSGGALDRNPNPAVSSVRDPYSSTTSPRLNSSVVARRSGTEESRRVTGSRGRETDAEPAVTLTSSARNDLVQNAAENRVDRNPAAGDHRNRLKATENGSKKLKISGSRNDADKDETGSALEESHRAADQTARSMTSGCRGAPDHHRTDSQSQLQQQGTPQARALAARGGHNQ